MFRDFRLVKIGISCRLVSASHTVGRYMQASLSWALVCLWTLIYLAHSLCPFMWPWHPPGYTYNKRGPFSNYERL